MNRHALLAFGFFLYGLVLFTFGLDHNEIIGFESRFYLFALEMWRHGPSWFATTYHQPYPDYPGTAILFIYFFSKMMGELCKFTAIFPSAVAASLTLSVTYLIGAQWSRRWGVCAVCFLLLTNAFVAEARTISLDQYITLITATCFYVALRGRTPWLFPLLIAGFAIRGPIGLVIPAGVICVFYLVEKEYRRFLLVGFFSALLLLVCMLLLLGLAYHEGGHALMQSVLQMQVSGRLQDVKSLPWYFYLVESVGAYALTYPVAVLVMLGILKITSSRRKILWQLAGWAIIILLGLSIPSDKKIRYILPFAPALALMCGYLFTVGRESKYFYFLQRILHAFCFFFPLFCMIALVFIQKKYPDIQLHYTSLKTFFILMQIILFVWHWRSHYRDIPVLLVASFSFVAAYVLIVEPINLQLNQTREFVQQVEEARAKEKAQLVFYREGTDGLVIKYLVNMTQDDLPVFVMAPEKLFSFPRATFFVSTEENFREISQRNFSIIFRGKIGREPFVIFRRQ